MAPRNHELHPSSAVPMLPTHLLLEIVARTDDFTTFVHCAIAVCKHLRRDILSPSFIRRFSQKAASSMLTHCIYDDQLLNPVRPVTSTAAHFCHDYLSHNMSGHAANHFGRYYPVTSRGGLVVLHSYAQSESERYSGLCVYDPMTGHHSFLSTPTRVPSTLDNLQAYVLLTATDGIDNSFMLLFFDVCESSFKVLAATSSAGTWGSVTYHASHHDFPWMLAIGYNSTAVLRGGIIHWPVYYRDIILTYDVGTGTLGRVKSPSTNGNPCKLHLATTPDGNLLKLLVIEGFKISVWLQLPMIPAGGGWSLKNVIDIQDNLQSVCPGPDFLNNSVDVVVYFGRSGKRSGDVVLLEVRKKYGCSVFAVFDMETKEVHTHEWSLPVLEINLSSRLETMKVFS